MYKIRCSHLVEILKVTSKKTKHLKNEEKLQRSN